MYMHKEVVVGDWIMVKNYAPMIRPGGNRGKRERPTTESRKRMNHRIKEEKVQMLILGNFDEGYHLILDYPKENRPETYEEADKNLMNLLYKVSRRQKKLGKKFRYLAITERGRRRAALHHHLIIQDDSSIIDDINSLWGNHMKFFRLYQDGAYKDLAAYFVKAETKEEQRSGKSTFHRSRNLKTAEIRREIRPGSFKDEPKAPEGFVLIKDTIINGYNERIGLRHQSFVCRKSEQKGDEKLSLVKKVMKFFKRMKGAKDG